ncbi:hypothetical protein [Embleya sp. NPDC050493]|uniref:hypothetical protein n=1 Tax=Embleya sp. NPDC050493 TaxID=3363989 RepID=UPI0037B40C1B
MCRRPARPRGRAARRAIQRPGGLGFFDCDAADAVRIANDVMTSRMRRFEHLVEHELPLLCQESALDDEARHELVRYVETLRNRMSGIR